MLLYSLAFVWTSGFTAWAWEEDYAFLAGQAGDWVPLDTRMTPPEGFARVELHPEGFGAWLRRLPVRPDGSVVRTYAGDVVAAPAQAVVPLDLGSGDLQQCADSVLRLYAEYRWTRGDAEDLEFHFTSGDGSRWSDWRRGERFRVHGTSVERVLTVPVADDHASYRAWLQHTFMYAGTRSLKLDAQRVPPPVPLTAGDVFVSPGSPGHAVLVLDVAVDEGGRRVGLLGQGFMPAQTFHVLKGQGGHVLSGWFLLPHDPEDTLKTPSWVPMSRQDVLRFDPGL